jgi:hypothetical protein
LLEATNGATLDIQSNIDNTANLPEPAGRIEAHGTNSTVSTVELEGITVTSGSITIDTGNTLEIENGTTHLTGVDVVNNGNLQVDSPASTVTATLVLDGGTTFEGHVTIGASGELDVNGATFNGDVTIDDYGIFDVIAGLTLDNDLTINRLQGGSFVDSGAIAIADSHSVKLSGADFGTLDIGNKRHPDAGQRRRIGRGLRGIRRHAGAE